MADLKTKEVAVGTVTCLTNFDLLRLVPVVVVGKGAAAVQAAGDFDGLRRPIIFNGFSAGTPVDQIFSQLAQVSGHQSRQYGLVDTSGGEYSFTGSENFQFAGGLVWQDGDFVVAVQGNILVGLCVIEEVLAAVLDSEADFPERLMRGMEAARATGGDGRCSCSPLTPTACRCPVRDFAKSGHIGGMIVARIGDGDAPVCNANGCAGGDYFMRLNVIFQSPADPDPVLQLRAQYDAWQAEHVGRADAIRSRAWLQAGTLPVDGVSTTTMRIELRDRGLVPVLSPGLGVTVAHAPNSDGVSTIGPVVDLGGGVYEVTLSGGVVAGVDRLRVTVDDPIRPVILMPDTTLQRCLPGPDCVPPPICGDDIVNSPDEQCDGSADSGCPGACRSDCTCPIVPVCGDNLVNRPGEFCDGNDDDACPGRCQADCTCPSPPVCGDGSVNQPNEACDGLDDAACPGACRPDCTCEAPQTAVPTTSTWALIILTALLLTVGRVLFGGRAVVDRPPD